MCYFIIIICLCKSKFITCKHFIVLIKVTASRIPFLYIMVFWWNCPSQLHRTLSPWSQGNSQLDRSVRLFMGLEYISTPMVTLLLNSLPTCRACLSQREEKIYWSSPADRLVLHSLIPGWYQSVRWGDSRYVCLAINPSKCLLLAPPCPWYSHFGWLDPWLAR